MTLQDVMATLGSRYPSEDKMVPDLVRMTILMDLLGSPQLAYPSIHLTGTNGKTSTARMIDSLVRAFGLRPGRYTSPHLDTVTERICVDGDPLPDSRFVEVFNELMPYVELVDGRSEVPMTFFELLTGMAFAAFADAPVDLGVIEVGLGGRWDATNVIHAGTAVVLPIGLDHVPLLGTTLAEVAAEKAGIIHPGATVILAAQPPEAAAVLLARAVEVGATVAREGLEFGVLARTTAVGGQLLTLQGLSGVYEDVFLPLHGAYQAANAAAALAAVEAFFGAGALDPAAVAQGFADTSSPGRLEVVRSSPTVLIDAAHNPHGMHATVAALLDAFSFTHLVAVVACLADKDVRTMLEILEPAVSSIVVTENTSPRRMPAEQLRELAEEIFGEDRVQVQERLDDALDVAMGIADSESDYGGSGVLVTGSVVTAGEARTLLKAR